jgi:hypothetical protein
LHGARREQHALAVEPGAGIHEQVADIPSRFLEVEILERADLAVSSADGRAGDLLSQMQHGVLPRRYWSKRKTSGPTVVSSFSWTLSAQEPAIENHVTREAW